MAHILVMECRLVAALSGQGEMPAIWPLSGGAKRTSANDVNAIYKYMP
jgi:hypothetical protein